MEKRINVWKMMLILFLVLIVSPISYAEGKDITITVNPDEIWEEEDYLLVTCDISGKKEITSGKITITYDQNVMSCNCADASDAMEGVMCSIKSPKDGKIEFEFSATTPRKMDGSMLDLYFDLKKPAEAGQNYEIMLTVNELKNGSKNLSSEVINKKAVVKKGTGKSDDITDYIPEKITKVEVFPGDSSIKLRWKKQDKAELYVIFVYRGLRLYKVVSTNKNYINIKGLRRAEAYDIKIIGTNIMGWGPDSKLIKTATCPYKTTITSIKKKKRKD